MGVRVKICGLTTPEDARLAADAGADAVGLVFAESPRQVEGRAASAIVRAIPPFVTPVGVFVDETVDRIVSACRSARIGVAQMSGRASAEDVAALRREGLRVVTAVHVTPEGLVDGKAESCGADAVLLDTRTGSRSGGTGTVFHCGAVKGLSFDVPLILAGGLTPDNVAERIEIISPWAVDTSSGVESSPGKKDPDLLRMFILNAKGLRARDVT